MPMPNHKGTAKSVLLRVAADLEAVGEPWDLEDLAVAACQEDPDQFGMRRYPCYPDTHRLRGLVDGKNGLHGKGYLQRIGPGSRHWKLTPEGRAKAGFGPVVKPSRPRPNVKTDKHGNCPHGLPPEYCAPCNGTAADKR